MVYINIFQFWIYTIGGWGVTTGCSAGGAGAGGLVHLIIQKKRIRKGMLCAGRTVVRSQLRTGRAPLAGVKAAPSVASDRTCATNCGVALE